MALRRWKSQEMIGLSNKLLDPAHDFGKTMRRIPELDGLRPRLGRVHGALVGRYGNTVSKHLAPIIQAQLVVDEAHDGNNRVVYYGLEAHIHLARVEGDEAAARALEELRDALMPDGLEVNGFSYASEASQAEIVASRLTPENKHMLAEIPLKQGTLLDRVHAVVAAGRQLSRLEDARTEVRDAARETTPGKARRDWIKVASILRRTLELSRGEDAGVDAILAYMEGVDRVAARRVKDPVEDEEPTEEPTDTTAGGGDDDGGDGSASDQDDDQASDQDDEASDQDVEASDRDDEASGQDERVSAGASVAGAGKRSE